MRIIASALVLVFVASPAAGQEAEAQASCRTPMRLDTYALNDAAAVLARALDVRGYGDEGASGIFKGSVRSVPVCTDSLAFLRSWAQPDTPKGLVEPAPVSLEVTGNSAYPRDRNNGAVWNGVGVNAQATLGFTMQRSIVTLGFLPVVTGQENAWYEYAASTRTNRSPYANPDHPGIDYPRRFGADAFYGLFPGQSFVRVDVGPVSAAASTENLWLGAMQIYPLLLSNTGPGFPHVRVGTPKGIDLKYVNVEAHAFVGELRESEYFDGNAGNDAHVFGGTVITLEPTFVPGLHLGIARVYHDVSTFTENSLGFYAGRLISSPFWEGGGNRRTENAIGTVFLRWKHPESGFEVYGEWGREDTPTNMENLIREPDWSRAWGLGLQKVMVSPNRLTRIYAEIIHLAEGVSVRSGNGYYTFYTHSQVTQGHTNRGQMLGAGLGPGSRSRVLGVDVFGAGSRTSFEFEHTRYDEDTYYRAYSRRYAESRDDTELTGQRRRGQIFGDFQVEGVVRYSYRWDRDFLSARQELPKSITETNWGTELRVRWLPRSRSELTGAN